MNCPVQKASLIMEPLLEVRDLSVRYQMRDGGEVFALSETSLRIESGEIVGVLGESGSGKSTLGASLLAMFPRNAAIHGGAILLQGKNLLELKRNELAHVRGSRVSLIFQEPGVALHPTMRVGLQIEEVLKAHTSEDKAARRREVRSLLDSIFGTEAERIYASYPHQLSGGQRQRTAIAQAIVCKPSLLIADEPTASLDSVTQREILELLKRLQKERNLAILFITHALELLNGFADRVVVMYAGEIVEEGEAAKVLRFPQHPYTQALLTCRPRLEQIENSSNSARVPVIPGDAPDLSVKVRGCAFAPRCPEKMQICSERMPEFSNAGNGAKVRCFKFGG
jgi:oligopeptide/dipeptide ABC transporter ATP-binding protein